METLMLEVSVGCNGVVSRVTAASTGDWNADLVACVEEQLAFAPFPAHALPDGDVFRFPLRYTPPE